MNLSEIIFKLVEDNTRNDLEKEIDNIISTIDTHIDMYNRAVNKNDVCMAVIVLNQCINHSINITTNYYKDIDINKLDRLSDNLLKAKNIINSVLDDTIKNIKYIIDEATIKDIDYSRYTKEELIEMLRNKQ